MKIFDNYFRHNNLLITKNISIRGNNSFNRTKFGMNEDTFQKSNELYQIDSIFNSGEFDGLTFFKIQGGKKKIIARHFINDSKNPPNFKQDSLVDGCFSIDLDEISKLERPEKSQIRQDDDNYSQITGAITKLEDNGDCVILAEGIKLETCVVPEEFKIGDQVLVKGYLEFMYHD